MRVTGQLAVLRPTFLVPAARHVVIFNRWFGDKPAKWIRKRFGVREDLCGTIAMLLSLGVVNTASENHQDYPDRPGMKTIGHAEVAARKMVADPFVLATPS